MMMKPSSEPPLNPEEGSRGLDHHQVPCRREDNKLPRKIPKITFVFKKASTESSMIIKPSSKRPLNPEEESHSLDHQVRCHREDDKMRINEMENTKQDEEYSSSLMNHHDKVEATKRKLRESYEKIQQQRESKRIKVLDMEEQVFVPNNVKQSKTSQKKYLPQKSEKLRPAGSLYLAKLRAAALDKSAQQIIRTKRFIPLVPPATAPNLRTRTVGREASFSRCVGVNI